MKTLFLILLLLPLFGLSQTVDKNEKEILLTKDSNGKRWNPSDTSYSYLFNGYRLKQDSAVHRPKFDTIKVVMLVSDTTIHNLYPKSTNAITSYFDNSAFWQYGFEILERKSGYNKWGYESACPTCPDYWEHVKYLDSNKNPLKPEIIVWMSKSITKN